MNLKHVNSRTWICILSLLIGYTNAGSPYIEKSSCGSYSTLKENFNGTVCRLHIIDSDSGDFITVRPNSDDTSIYFDIIRESGTNNIWVNVTVKKLLDRETLGGIIKLKLVITDKQFNEVEYELSVYITDVNDNYPIFQNLPYVLDIDELPCHNNTVVYSNVSANDTDSGSYGTVTYFMTPKAQSEVSKELYNKTFSIDENNGSVSIHQCLDYETNMYYQFTLTAKDGGGKNTTVDFIIRVKDVQDMPPFFTQKSYIGVVNENEDQGTFLVRINAEDGDTGVSNDVFYEITESSCGNLFDIGNTTGVISTKIKIDRESESVKNESGNCIVTVAAEESNRPGVMQYGKTNSKTNVTITVKDLDDNSPQFSNVFYKANISENAAKYVPLTLYTDIYVSDGDQDLKNARMTITLKNENGSDCTDFYPSPNKIQRSGNIQIMVNNSKFLDFEKIQNTTIKVIATEDVNSTSTAEAIVQIEIMDVNDVSPKFNRTSFKLSIKESTKNGKVIGQITATDGDRSEKYKKLTYSINGGNGRFIVDNTTTGYIRVNCSNCTAQLDREKQDIYYLTYTAEDIDKRSDSVSLTVELTDINDNKPIFLSTYKVVIDENDEQFDEKNKNKIALVTLEARDADEIGTNNSQVVYCIIETSPNNLTNNFTINTVDKFGEIYLTAALDYEKLNETEGEINITVESSDKGNPSLNNIATVNLHVQDINDNPPIFNATDYNATVSEDATSKENNLTHVTQVFANDADCTKRNSFLNYIIKTGGSDRFTIDARTGIVSVQIGVKLDREKTSNYSLEIMAIDQGYPPKNSTTKMFIVVTDVNDSPPTFNQSKYDVSIKENTSLSKAVFRCKVTDLDLNSKLRYNIIHVEAFDEAGRMVNISHVSDIHTAVESYFGINNTGTVFVNEKLDRETAQRIILTLKVKDENAAANIPQTATATLTINLEDVNDNEPQFSNDSYKFSIIENAQNGTIIGTVTATDKDVNRTITYSLSDGSKSKFIIDSKTGVLSKFGLLDREKRPTENVTVNAKDNGIPSKNNSVDVIIDVADFNDNTPQFGNFNRTVHLSETSCNGTTVLVINATDSDEGPNKDITFSIESDEEKFEINRMTGNQGKITVKNVLDREKKSKYTLTVKARDNPIDKTEQKSNDTIITIVIDDVNDNCPNFTLIEYSVVIAENQKNGTSITTVSANDADAGENARISYTIISSLPENDFFTIDDNTGAIYVVNLLNDKIGTYNLTVVAKDHGTPSLNGTTYLSIEVTDVNTHHPEIINVPDGRTISVYECATTGAIIHTFNYTDEDFSLLNKNATFKMIDNGNESNAFNLTENGALIVQDKLDVNKKSRYTIEIQATDNGVPPLSSDVVVIYVNVLDVNDHLPSFKKKDEELTLVENKTFTDSVGQVTAYDEDREPVFCYNMKESNWTDYFSIEKADGKIFTMKKLDYEKSHSIKFIVEVKDCSITENTTHCGTNKSEIIKKNRGKTNATINVTITVLDRDDNPPVFRQKSLATGMRRQTEADTELELHLRNNSYISDADTPENGVLSWTFSNSGNITISPELQEKIKPNSGVKNCDDGNKHIFCVTKNGTIVNNKFFKEDLSGYFIVTVNVSDKAGYDTAEIRIYLISDSQIVTMTIRNPKETVASLKDELLSELSRILGYTAVFDSIQDHKENGVLNTQNADLKFHIVKPETQEVLSGKESIELFDKQANSGEMIRLQNTYNVMKVTQQNMVDGEEDTGSKKLTLILVAVSAAEALIIAIIIFVALSARNKFRRKLKAAVINTPDMEMHALEQKTVIVPGSNLYSKQNNPLLNADIKNAIQNVDEDVESAKSADGDFEDVDLDENVVDDHTTVYDRIEEKEATMDMYNDDTFHSISSEDLLDATLNLHAMRKSKESLDKISDDDGYDVTHHSPNTAAAFINETFTSEDLESTEI